MIKKNGPSSRIISHCATYLSALASLALLSGREGGSGGSVSRHCQGACGLATAERKGGRNDPVVSWWQHCNAHTAVSPGHWQRVWRAVALVDVPLHFRGCNVHAAVGQESGSGCAAVLSGW